MSGEMIGVSCFVWIVGIFVTCLIQYGFDIPDTTCMKISNSGLPAFYKISASSFLIIFWPLWISSLLVMGPIALFKVTKKFKDEELKIELEQLIKRAEKISGK